jgi:tetratricopeptide (TPR) repeat protein
MTRRSLLLLSALFASACGGSTGITGASGPPHGTFSGSAGFVAAMPIAAEQAMIDDLTHHRTSAVGPTEAALLIGGARDPNEVTALAKALDAIVDGIVRELPGEPTARARRLLEALFTTPTGSPLLQQYAADATTLYGAVTTGRFNCVSATTLYVLAAQRAGLEVRPVLLPSHARAAIVIGGRRFVVETTTPNGFDAPPSVSREAQDRARPKGPRQRVDLYADEKGTEVDWNALLAVTYGNLAIFAQDRGDTVLAASLLAREGALTPPAQAPFVQMQQLSLLTELATRALNAGRRSEALALARRAEEVAPDASSKRLGDQNIAAIATQQLMAEEPTMSDAALEAFPEPLRAYPAAYGDVRASMLTLLAQRRLKHGDVNGSAAALQEAAGVATSDDMRGQTGHNARLGEVNRVASLSTTDPEAAWAQWQRLGPPDPALGDTETKAAHVIAQNRAVRFSNAGQCAELEGVVTSTAGIDQANGLRASCRARHALALAEKRDFKDAIDELRTATRLDPSDPQHRQNLVVMIEKEVDRLIHASHCAQAVPLMTEGRTLGPTEVFWSQAAAFCQLQ